MRAKIREHPEMIVRANSAEYRAWPPNSGYASSGSGPNLPRTPGACVLDAVSLNSGSKRQEELYVDLTCDGKEFRVMVPLHRKPDFQRYIESVLRENIGETVDQICEVEIEWPQPEE